MKTLRNFLVAVVCSVGFMSATYTSSPVDSMNTELRSQVAQLVDQPQFLVNDATTVNVSFQLNNRGEIVVLDVDTDNVTLDNYIRSRLNYQSTSLDDYSSGLTYYIDLRFEGK